MNLDKIDLKILRILQEDGRKSYREIGRELKISEGTVRARIKKMRENGIINGFYISVNPHKLGKDVIAILGLYLKPSEVKKTLEILKSYDEITQLYQTTGEYDAVCVVVLEDMEELGRFLSEKIYPLVNVNGCKVTLVLNILKDGHKIPI